MSRSLKIRNNCLEKAKLSLKRNGFHSQRALAEDSDLALSTVSNFLTGKAVDYATFVEICEKLTLDWQSIADLGNSIESHSPIQNLKSKIQNHTDWGEAIDVSIFYNRTAELTTLQQWIVNDRCRLVTLLGMGGIGKTSLSIKLGEQIQTEFDYIIWRSLRNAPPIQDLLANLLLFLSNQQETHLPETFDAQLSQLMTYLRASRCLLILDNAESILQSGGRAGCYQAGYEGYGQLFKVVGETSHNSCLVLTSRETPQGLAALEGDTLPVRCLKLTGLSAIEGRKIFQAKGTFTASEAQWSVLNERYAGNPLALKIVASAIKDFFDGDIASFLPVLEQDTFIFDELYDLLGQQFGRLTPLEQEMMYWLAINREPVLLSELQVDFARPISPGELLQTLASLQRRSLIEKVTTRFTQQPVVMEYVTRQLIEQIVQEITGQNFNLFRNTALIKTTAKDYVRETQIRLILQPLIDKLLVIFESSASLETSLVQSLSLLRGKSPQEIGYAGGNSLNLLRQLQVDVSGYDFSHLTMWQANFAGMNLQNVNFSHSDLSGSMFSETLDEVLAVALSQDGQLLATGDNDGKICLWQVQTGQQLLSWKGHTNWVRSVAFSPVSPLSKGGEGGILVSGSADRTIKLWDVQTGYCLQTFIGHESEVYSVAFSQIPPNHATLLNEGNPRTQVAPLNKGGIIVSGSTDRTIKLWDINTGECLQTFSGHSKEVFAIAISPDGNLIASGSADQTVKLWDVRTGECLRTLSGHTNWVMSVAFSPDGLALFSCSPDHTIRQWDVKTGDCLKIYKGHTNWVLSIAVSPLDVTGKMPMLLVSGSGDQTVKLWDVSTGQCLNTFTGHSHGVFAVAFSGEGKTIASGSLDQTVRLWDVSSKQCLRTLAGHTNRVYSVAVSSDEKILASASFDASVRLWDIKTGKCLKTLVGHNKQVYSVAFSCDGQILASGGDRTIKLWDVKTGQCLKTLIGHENWVYSVAFSPDGQILASGSGDHTIKLWDVKTGQCLKTLSGHTTWVWSVAFSPDGHTLVSGSGDRTIKLWDVKTGECLKTLSGHTNRVYSVAFSPISPLTKGGLRGDHGSKERILASGSFDHTIKLWDINTGQCLKTLTGHNNGVYSVAFSPNNQTLVSGSLDHTVKLWDVKTGKCIRTYTGHTNEVRSVIFSKDGKTLVSGSQDQTVRLWDVNTGECCQILKATRLYEGMNITEVKGLTEGQKATLKTLGALSVNSYS